MTIHYSALNDKFWIRDGNSEGVLWFDTEAAAREYQRTEQLKTVLKREADSQRRHDEKVERLEAEIERLRVEAQAQYHRGYYDGRAALGETK